VKWEIPVVQKTPIEAASETLEGIVGGESDE
jgi:hypothetical protein